jgi:transposase
MARKKLKSKKKSSKTQDRIKVENGWDRLFLLHIRKSLYIIIVWALSIIVHNLIYKFSAIDEPFFTIIAIYIIPVYLLISLIYTLSKHKRIEGKR